MRYKIDNTPADSLPTVEFIKDALAGDRYRRISVSTQPRGYWSQVVNAHICIDYRTGKPDVSMGHSSGGRSPEEEPDDTVAETNFANAILELADWVRKVRYGLLRAAP